MEVGSAAAADLVSQSISTFPSGRVTIERCSPGFVVIGGLVAAGKLTVDAEVCGCEVIVTLGGEDMVTFGAGLHNGDIALASVLRG